MKTKTDFTPEQMLRRELLVTLLTTGMPVDCAMLWVARLEAVVRTGIDPGPQQGTRGTE